MEILLKHTWDETVEDAIKIGKETGCIIRFVRDGVHGTDDLNVILKFQLAGFKYFIERIESKYDKQALEVTFRYTESN